MKSHAMKLIVMLPLLALMNGCSNKAEYLVDNDSKADYILVVDKSKMAAIERARLNSSSNLQTIWIHLPTKRIKKSDLKK